VDHQLKIGLFGIGLDAYWEQFTGLEDRLKGYLSAVEDKLNAIHPKVINLGLIDNSEKAFEAGRRFRRENVDVIFLHITTYALSATVLPVVQRAKVPVIILNLAPEAAIDYEIFNRMRDRTRMTGEWLAHCSTCAVPEMANVFNRTGIRFYQVTGMLNDDPECWEEVREWVEAARVANIMAYNRMGCMGHYYSGMLDIYADLTQQYACFGGHIELLEVDELAALRNLVTPEQISERVKLFEEQFDVQEDCAQPELERAARTSVALDALVKRHQLGSLAYYYKGTGNVDNEDTISSIILGNSLLTANGVPVAGEYEIKNAQAMKIMDSFGAGGSFTEFYAMDFKADVVPAHHCAVGIGHVGSKIKKLGKLLDMMVVQVC
jgi:L-arabinose isomerase